MPTDSARWRRIREDFESLPPADWSLIWSSRPPVSLAGAPLPSQWTWFHPTDAGLRARASAIFLKAAKALGYDHEDKWLDELRYADFVRFQISGSGTAKLPDGTLGHSKSGVLKDAVNHSITLCHQLEAGGADVPPKSRAGRREGGPVDGKKLRQLRKKFDLSQADFAEKCEPQLSEDTIQRAERGDAVDPKTADILVQVLIDLGCSEDEAKAIRRPQ